MLFQQQVAQPLQPATAQPQALVEQHRDIAEGATAVLIAASSSAGWVPYSASASGFGDPGGIGKSFRHNRSVAT